MTSDTQKVVFSYEHIENKTTELEHVILLLLSF